MAVDAAVLKAVEVGESPPTLRLYGWEPYCVSLGYFQKPQDELDPMAMRTRGWDFVLRATGGRAVLHAEELTYSLIARRDEAPWCATLALSYDRIAQALASVLGDFGLQLAAGVSVGTRHAVSLQAAHLPCFASTSRSELTFSERKVVGSAQRRMREAFLQHGSIPLTPDHERLVEVLRLDEAGKESYLQVLRAHAVSLGEIAKTPPEVERGVWERKVAFSMLTALGVDGVEGSLTLVEQAYLREHEAEHSLRLRKFLEN